MSQQGVVKAGRPCVATHQSCYGRVVQRGCTSACGNAFDKRAPARAVMYSIGAHDRRACMRVTKTPHATERERAWRGRSLSRETTHGFFVETKNSLSRQRLFGLVLRQGLGWDN